MPPIIVLKRRHHLKNDSILKVMRKFKEFKATPRMEFARYKSNEKTEDLSADDIKRHFKNITGEDAAQVLDLAGAASSEDNLRKILHVAIILANEIGQPSGSDLQEREVTDEEDDQAGPSVPKKTKSDDSQLIQRITNLEKTREESVKELKEKVRSLAPQSNTSEALILLSLDDLARKSRKLNDPEADVFEELWRQANRHQGSVNFASFTLSVIGGKASDIVVKAMAKCMKEKQVEEKISSANYTPPKPIETVSPIANAYPAQFMPPLMMPQNMTGWPQPTMFPFANSYQTTRRAFGATSGQWRHRGACYFCSSPDHTVKDCEKMKLAKNK